MATTATTRRTLAAAAAAAVAVGALTVAPSAVATGDAPRHVSPGTVERLHATCVDGAPRTPDSHGRWFDSCRDRAAVGLN